jgi:hypothetical protein
MTPESLVGETLSLDLFASSRSLGSMFRDFTQFEVICSRIWYWNAVSR